VNLVAGVWTDVDLVTATGATTTWLDPFPRPGIKNFYRLTLPQPQVSAVHPMALSSTVPTTVYFTGQCFDGTELFFLNGIATAGLVFDSPTQVRITLPPQAPGVIELRITDSLTNPLGGGIVTVPVNPQGLRPEIPPVNPPAAPSGAHMCTAQELYDSTLRDVVKIGGAGDVGKAWVYMPSWNCPLTNGETWLQTHDLVVPGVGLHFDFARTYRSVLGEDRPMGFGWTHSYDIRARKDSPTAVTVFDGAGRADVFTLGVGGAFECPERFERGALSGGGTVFTLTFPCA
jgi:Domain of unknown function (DUF6531)